MDFQSTTFDGITALQRPQSQSLSRHCHNLTCAEVTMYGRCSAKKDKSAGKESRSDLFPHRCVCCFYFRTRDDPELLIPDEQYQTLKLKSNSLPIQGPGAGNPFPIGALTFFATRDPARKGKRSGGAPSFPDLESGPKGPYFWCATASRPLSRPRTSLESP